MVDHLTAWCEIRDRVAWADVRHGLGWPRGPVRAGRDGLAHRITTVEHARNATRAQRMLSAYGQMRQDAAAGKILDFRMLANWQCTVLGVADAPFRDSPAFAKDGRERYGLSSDTSVRFADCLAASKDHDVPVAARAARLYLDVNFFHPFADGNARSALLALAFVLAGEGIVLDEVGPLAQVRRPADDAEGAAGLANLVVALIEGTQRRLRQTVRAAFSPN
jgi:Fic/DOC family